jgi:uncharacterized protein with HEPN domain
VPPRAWNIRIEDMIEAIERIQNYTQGLSYDDFSADTKTVDAVVRNFELLGEAAGHVPPEIQKSYPNLPWSKIRGMRNLLTHEYFGISDSILWTTATVDLKPLLPLLREILNTSSK